MSTLITKEVVFTIAQKLITQGIYPTQNNVREMLGHGSMRDIGFYLREWKQQCLTANKTAPLLQEELANVTVELDDLTKEKTQYNKITSKLQQQIDELTLKLADAQHRAGSLELQNENLQIEINLSKTENQQLREQYHTCKEILHEREQKLDIFMTDKNILIDKLRQEMKETMQQSIEETRIYNYQQHELLIKHQVENMNLQLELKETTKKIREKDDQILTLNLTVATMKRELKEKTAIIDNFVTKEE